MIGTTYEDTQCKDTALVLEYLQRQTAQGMETIIFMGYVYDDKQGKRIGTVHD